MSNLFVAARARVKKGYLLPREILEGLLEQKTIEDALEILKASDYKKEILEVQQPYELIKIEQALTKNMIRHMFELIQTSLYSEILLAYFQKFVIHNLKLVLKGKALGKKYSELYDSLVLDAEAYLGRRDIIIKALEIPTLEEAVVQLSKYSFGKEITLAYNAYKENKKLGVFDIVLDKAWINVLIDTFTKANMKVKEVTKDLIGVEVDSYNILSILRAKYLGFDTAFQKELITKKTFLISPDILSNLILTESLESCFRILKTTYYKFLISEEMKSEEDIEKLERNFQRYLFNIAKSKAIKTPLTMGETLAYIKLKEAEIHNIMTILFGIENGIKPSRIQEMLFL